MGSSIQDYVKKINSSLTLLDCVSLLVTSIFLTSFLCFLYIQQREVSIPVSYESRKLEEGVSFSQGETRPFASILGKTYTFSWCMGSNRISLKNVVYFSSEEEALHSGRMLSKLCKK
jgi:hypothetical protein